MVILIGRPFEANQMSFMSSMSSSLQIVLGGFLVNLDGTFWNLPGLSRQRLCSVLPILLNEVAGWCWEIMGVMVQGFFETELRLRMSARCDGGMVEKQSSSVLHQDIYF